MANVRLQLATAVRLHKHETVAVDADASPQHLLGLQRAMTLELVDQYRPRGAAPAEQAAAHSRS
jgi:hypothetical protein